MLVHYTVNPNAPLSEQQKEELRALAGRPDSEIDTSDIPEWTDDDWENAISNPRDPNQTATDVRIDNDVLAWLKSVGPAYRIRINRILRDAMLRAKAPQSEGQQAETVDTTQQAA